MVSYEKAGYLVDAFRVFHLLDTHMKAIPFHYHDFHKIIFFLQGKGTYIIEGKSYALHAGDMIFVSAGEIHRPRLDPTVPYERMVIYVAPAFLSNICEREGVDLSLCFRVARGGNGVMREAQEHTHSLLFHMDKLEKATHAQGFGKALYSKILFMEFMILLNRALQKSEVFSMAEDVQADPKIQEVLRYIAQHLTEPLPIERLVKIAYLSRYHLMRQFKKATGRGIHAYIREKRLLLARERMKEQDTLAQIALDVGFADYSTFSRAFSKEFHVPPLTWRRNYRNSVGNFLGSLS